MVYVCIENGAVVSFMEYLPNVPPSVRLVEIEKAAYDSIIAGTHTFEVGVDAVVPVAPSVIAAEQQRASNSDNRRFLRDTDWKILRHMREQTLGLPMSLTPAEFIALEQARAAAAAAVV